MPHAAYTAHAFLLAECLSTPLKFKLRECPTRISSAPGVAILATLMAAPMTLPGRFDPLRTLRSPLTAAFLTAT
jgi:hypothetical protein